MKSLYRVHLSVETDRFNYEGPEVRIVVDLCHKFNEENKNKYFSTLDKAYSFVKKQINIFVHSNIGELLDTEVELKQYDFEDVPCKYITTTFHADGGKYFIMGACYPEKIELD